MFLNKSLNMLSSKIESRVYNMANSIKNKRKVKYIVALQTLKCLEKVFK